MKISKLHIQGTTHDKPLGAHSSDDVLQFKTSVIIEPQARDANVLQSVELGDNDVVEMVFEDNTVWLSSSFTLDELFPELRVQQRSMAPGEGFTLPLSVRSSGEHRGIVGDIVLKAVNIFTKKPVAKGIRKLAIALEEKQLGNDVGLLRLKNDFSFQKITGTLPDELHLLFLHGTASSTHGSFGDLQQTSTWEHISKTYGNNVLAFQHASLSKSPLQNVKELVEALPGNISLDLVSQSRGGLVGELLSRFCTNDGNRIGFTKTEMAYFKEMYSEAYYREFEGMVNKIRALLNKKNIQIRKFIRVACPAHGTTLASKRLDNFLNVSLNLIGLELGWAGPVYAAFKNLAASVVDCKNDVDVLPGLEAMDPRSAFIDVINRPYALETTDVLAIDNSLAVISGNAKASISLKGLLVIATKLFYLGKNDFIVDTKSMYLGTKRLQLVQYFFDEGTEVQHFNYFKNDKTREALLNALKTDAGAAIPGFIEMNQDTMRSPDREAFGLEGGGISYDKVTGKKPILVLLPGIMGSNLAQHDNLIWIKYLKMIAGNLTHLNIDAKNINAPSLIKTSYAKLAQHLSEKYDVVTFAFDWRLQLNKTAAMFSEKIEGLLKYNQPVKIIAHSMGGVLVRDFMITQPVTWQKLNLSAGFRLVFLGSPLGGSYRIPAVLFGQDSIIDKLSKIDIFHSKRELLAIFSRFPGILSLLPVSTEKDNDFSLPATWKKIAQTMEAWPVPTDTDLTEFGTYRDAIVSAVESMDYTNAVYIAGKDKATPCGYALEQTGPSRKELVILCTAEGDQSVTWESGIPKKMIAADSVYYVNVTHGALANEPGIFNAIDELLETGRTNLISRNRPVVRGDEKLFKQPEQFDFDLSAEGFTNTLLGIDTKQEEEKPNETPLKVFVSHGDLKYATYPVLAGHFINDGIVNAEKRIDSLLNGTLTERSQLNLYPGDIGSSEQLITDSQNFKGAIIVGLGKQGELSAFALAQTIEQSATKYLLDLNNKALSKGYNKSDAGSTIGLSPLVIGSYYGGLTPENSVRAILTGIQNANRKLNLMYNGHVKNITEVELVEQFEDRAINCFYIVSKIAQEPGDSLNIAPGAKLYKTLLGAKKRLAAQTGDEWWNRIKVVGENSKEESPCLRFTLSTTGAREEERDLYVNFQAVKEFYAAISDTDHWTVEIATTLFEMLIPYDFKPQLKRQNNLLLLLDEHTAKFPWELLQDKAAKAHPLCINAGMIRQLATQNYRTNIETVAGNHALIIGDPDLKNPDLQLKGAFEEASSVSKILSENGYAAMTKIRAPYLEIYKSIHGMDYNYKIIHLAGHGKFDPNNRNGSGMLIGPDIYFTTADLQQIPSVEFVFVNCCYLGQVSEETEKRYQDHYKLAANFGTQLIQNGVRAVIAAGWRVNDDAALDFTNEFYKQMFDGNTFGESVKRARERIYKKHPGTNTWGAYQCYGDPYYKFKTERKPGKSFSFSIAKEAEIELDNLHREIDTGIYTNGTFLTHLTAISDAVEKAGVRNQKITEQEALIYSDICEYEIALQKFRQLFRDNEAQFMVSTFEKYCMARAKKYVQDKIQGKEKENQLLIKINSVIKDLEHLVNLGSTAQRSSLLGAAYKRRAFLCSKPADKIKAMGIAADYYLEAYTAKEGKTDAYILANYLELMCILVLDGSRQWNGKITQEKKTYDITGTDQALKLVHDKKKSIIASPSALEFWAMVAEANLELCIMMLEMSSNVKEGWKKAYEAYEKVWNYAGAEARKLSEIEQLDLLLDGLSVVDPKNKQAANLIKAIGLLKKDLEKIILK